VTAPVPDEILVGERGGRSLSFDRVAAEYDATRGGEARGAWHASLLAPHLDPARPVLEVGVGTGAVALGLVRAGFAVHGVDLSPAMLRSARERLGGVVVAADATALPLRSAGVAQAVCVWVLHLVGDVAAVIAEVSRVLEPGGRWVVVPGGGDPPETPDVITALTVDMERRLHGGAFAGPRPSPRRLEALAAESGLTLEGVVSPPTIAYAESPEEAATKLERRTFSACWDLDDATYAEVVAPVVAALRALPYPDQPIQRESARQVVVVLRKGASG